MPHAQPKQASVGPQSAIKKLALPQAARLAASLGKGSCGEVWSVETVEADDDKRQTDSKTDDKPTDASFVRVPMARSSSSSSPSSEPTTIETGRTWSASDNANDRWIVKVSQVVGDPKLLDTYRREVYFLRRLRSADNQIVPLLRESRIDGQTGIQVIERFDGTLKDLGRKQAIDGRLGHNPKFLVYTSAQLKRVAAVAKQLEDAGIIHGDAKPSNLLYRNNGDDIRFADFGFAGTVDGDPFKPLIGFPRHYGCCPDRELLPNTEPPSFKLRIPYPDAVLKKANSGQLYMILSRGGDRLFVRTRDGAHVRLTEKRLRRLFGIGPDELAAIRSFYRTF